MTSEVPPISGSADAGASDSLHRGDNSPSLAGLAIGQSLQRVFQFVLPSLLAIAHSLFWFWPSRTVMNGYNEDVYFNYWTYEMVWKHLEQLGLFHLFSNEFWQAPIFYPQKMVLALSETQPYIAVVTWPLKQLLGSTALTLTVFSLAMSLGAYILFVLWLKQIGAKKFSWWGGLFFAACGWLQLQTFHYQNLCLFLFPLALLAWGRFKRLQTPTSLFTCVLAFGWIAGWNLYFQMFANAILVVVMVPLFFGPRGQQSGKKSDWSLKLKLLVLGVLSLAIELPIFMKYVEVGHLLGGNHVTDQVFQNYSANFYTFLSRVPTLLQSVFGFYPQFTTIYEGSSFIGITWLVCTGLAWRKKELRGYVIAAFVAFWLSLGPAGGLFYLIRYLPGFSAMRAIGRFEFLFVIFSIPALILWAEERFDTARLSGVKPWASNGVMILIALELIPGAMPQKKLLTPLYDQPEVPPLISELRRLHVENEPLVIVPGTEVHSKYLLFFSRWEVPLYQGYTSRELANEFTLKKNLDLDPKLATTFGATAEERLKNALLFSGTKRMVSVNDTLTEQMKDYPYLTFDNCFQLYDYHACLFEVKSDVMGEYAKKYPVLHLDQADTDAAWEYPSSPRGQNIGQLKAMHDGVLDYNHMNACSLWDTLKFPHLPAFVTHRPLPHVAIRGAVFHQGDVILDEIAKKPWFKLSESMRPVETYEIRCAHQ